LKPDIQESEKHSNSSPFSNMTQFIRSCCLSLLFAPFCWTAGAAEFHPTCEPPHWNTPAESNDGVFTGDLTMECQLEGGSNWNPKLSALRQKVIDKIREESVIHEGPTSLSSGFSPTLKWDASHTFAEDGNSVYIREIIQLSSPSKDEIKYETSSKQVEATGMAGYLRSVQFSMEISKKEEAIQILFRNRVQVKRPWYALDLIFAPIARKVCFEKMEKVKEKFFPWILSSLSETQ
jgi:hypothetical protein